MGPGQFFLLFVVIFIIGLSGGGQIGFSIDPVRTERTWNGRTIAYPNPSND
jgi:hypothetical protein